jgi:hypothetical protein
MRALVLAVLLALLAATPAAAHHADSQQNARLSSLEVKLNDALNRIAALEARVAKLEATPTPSPTPTPTASPSATPTPTSTPTATATPSPTPSPTATPAPTLTLTQVDGGAGWNQAHGLHEFPIGVWGAYNHTQANRDLDAAAGLNTYVWVADPCNGAPAIRADGRFRVVYDESENRSCAGSETVGWSIGDEVDMCCGPPGFDGGNGYDMLTQRHSSLPTDGRFRYTNYGKGVMFWETDQDAARFVNLPFLGAVSNDIYWFTDPNERSRAGYGKAASYGATVDRMRHLDGMDGERKPIWNFVETGWPFTESASAGGRSIRPDEMRAAVWHSLIAGARGILYFQHSFAGPCGGDHHTLRSNCEGTRAMAASVNAQIKSLAPVLNSPTVTGGTSTSSGVRSMVKWDGEHFYVFAGARENIASLGSVTIPCVGDATATVLGENRTVPVQAGKVTDNFADGNAVHVYRVDGGSSCGL